LVVASLAVALSLEANHHVRSDTDTLTKLSSLLSRNASIILPSNPRFTTVHQRWQAYSKPTYSAVVEVATEEDVVVTVRFANTHGISFLAVAGAHGFSTTLAKLQGGIAISFINMKAIKLAPGGHYAELQPGLTNGELIRSLWAQGKLTTTGNCLCTGVIGIALGGGHGYLQGLFGRLADQILEASVVLADGKWVTVSPRENKDLFWALRGSGHNFGIVTSFKYKVYDAIPLWTLNTMAFTQDKLEQVFELANEYIDEADHPAELIIWYTFIKRLDLDRNSVSSSSISSTQAKPPDLNPFTAAFRALGPVKEDVNTKVGYPEIFDIRGNNESSLATCGKGWYRHLVPNYLKKFNIPAQRKVQEIFTNITTKYPSIAQTSIYAMEGYSQQKVTRVPSESTAVPYRGYPLLLSPVWGYTNASYSADIIAASKAIREALVEGSTQDYHNEKHGKSKGNGKGTRKQQPLRAYNNYAFGDESLVEMYGADEPWRLQKMRKLKSEYDPEGKFLFSVLRM
ncbi:FAD-binding domain-containing protein, partial [Podospora australis]